MFTPQVFKNTSLNHFFTRKLIKVESTQTHVNHVNHVHRHTIHKKTHNFKIGSKEQLIFDKIVLITSSIYVSIKNVYIWSKNLKMYAQFLLGTSHLHALFFTWYDILNFRSPVSLHGIHNPFSSSRPSAAITDYDYYLIIDLLNDEMCLTSVSERCYLFKFNIRGVNDENSYSIPVRRLQVAEFLGVPYYMFLFYGIGLRSISLTLKVKWACQE
ncbi:hypothetical protein AGLY_013182 [Aphis glycines]|uniref:Uncharacterized protein n=1 Tax=Aphis glycines TaxID=307491 RepID=A0A6G0T5L1_APHGL|nr:hypothetical protein AGLY_013182 [Aphis glycines]